MLFKDLYELYWTKHVKLRVQHTDNIHYFWKSQGVKWAYREVETIQTRELQDWFDDIAVISKSAAVKYCNTLSTMIAWGIKRGYLNCTNPCRDVQKVKLRARERFLLPEEVDRFKQALAMSPRDLQDLFWLLLLTGARKGNVFTMEWDEVNTALAMWTIPAHKHKNQDSHINVLTPPALAILERRKKQAKGRYVFPGRLNPDAPKRDAKRGWSALMRRADIKDFRIHDLRRTFGSYMAINGSSIPIIAQALGHNDHRSTAIYARLNLDPVRSAIEASQNRFINP